MRWTKGGEEYREIERKRGGKGRERKDWGTERLNETQRKNLIKEKAEKRTEKMR